MQRNGGSLLRATLSAQPDAAQAPLSGVSYFAVPAPEPKVLKKHDLVTIIVREETDFSATGTSDLKKQLDLDAKIEQFVRLSLEEFALKNTIGADQPEIKISGRNNFKGEATVDRTDSLTTRITAEVVDVKPNGTLVLQAKAHTKFDEEEMTMILSGACRAEDVTADNTILSTQLHDKDVVKQHKGAVRDTTRRGLIPRLFEMIRLF
jgi:flagellar L-ring protein precursor FlgH